MSKLPLIDAFRAGYWKRILLGLGFIIGGTAMTYASGVFAIAYLESVIHVPAVEASLALVIGYTVLIIFSPIFGLLADKYGRKPFMIAYAVGTIVFIYPYFLLLSTGQLPLIILAQAIYNFMRRGSMAPMQQCFLRCSQPRLGIQRCPSYTTLAWPPLVEQRPS